MVRTKILTYVCYNPITLHQEVWFKVSSHSSPKGTLWLEYEPHWVKRNIKCQGQVMFDRQMNI